MLGQKKFGDGVLARNINKLSARTVETLKAPGRYSDGGNLYLSISANGGRRWVFMYRFGGKQREMGLGSASRAGTSLARARELAAEARIALAAGLDPLEARKAACQAERIVPTFGECADAYVETHSKSWRNDKHVAQWKMTLTTYCAPDPGIADRRDRHRGGAEGAAADLGATARDCQAPSGPHREGPRCSRGSWLQDG